MSKYIYITGAPGTGKSTLTKVFKKKGIVAFDIDEVDGLCSWVNKETGVKAGEKETNKE